MPQRALHRATAAMPGSIRAGRAPTPVSPRLAYRASDCDRHSDRSMTGSSFPDRLGAPLAQPEVVADNARAECGLQRKQQAFDFRAWWLPQRFDPRPVVRREGADRLERDGIGAVEDAAVEQRQRRANQCGGGEQEQDIAPHRDVSLTSASSASSARLCPSSRLTTKAVSSPSVMASGTCVSAKMVANLTNEPEKPLAGSGNASASCAAVVT